MKWLPFDTVRIAATMSGNRKLLRMYGTTSQPPNTSLRGFWVENHLSFAVSAGSNPSTVVVPVVPAVIGPGVISGSTVVLRAMAVLQLAGGRIVELAGRSQLVALLEPHDRQPRALVEHAGGGVERAEPEVAEPRLRTRRLP